MPAHGTRSCYQSGCRLPECREANATHARQRRAGSLPASRPCRRCGEPAPYRRGRSVCEGCRAQPMARRGHLPVCCWCEEHIVLVPVAEVRACRTRSCGQPTCRAA